MSENKLLDGIKVIELSTFIAASTCGRMLSEIGADVIKVETGVGDNFRGFGKANGCPDTEIENPYYDQTNGHKRSLVVNLKDPKGTEIMYKLLKDADVFLTNSRTGALEKQGLGWGTLKEKFPRLIYAQITGFGDKGPSTNLPGYDASAFWAASGFMRDMMVDSPTSYPVTAGNGFGDTATGTTLMAGICAALFKREKTGRGDRVEASLMGTAIWHSAVLAMPAQDFYGMKYPKDRYQTNSAAYKCSDGEWILPVFAAQYEKHYPLMCKAVGHPELIEDPRLKTRRDYGKNKDYLIETFEKIFITNTYDHWAKAFEEYDIPSSKVRHFNEVFKDPQCIENGYVVDHKMPSGNTCKLVVPSLRSEQNGFPEAPVAALFGEHTESILKDLGYSDEEIKSLEETGTVTAHK